MEFPKNAKFIKGYIYEPKKEQRLYPSFLGNMDNIDKETLNVVGQTVLHVIYTE